MHVFKYLLLLLVQVDIVFTYASYELPPQASITERKVVVVSVSPQSRASLAAHYNLSSSEAGRRLTSFFKSLGKCDDSSVLLQVDLGRHNHS